MGRNRSKAFWQDHIDACDKSDLKQVDYCAKHNIAVSTFGYWKRKLRESDSKNQVFYPLTIPSGRPKVPEEGNAGIIVSLGGGRFSIKVEKEFSTIALSQIITTLEQL
ncbi:IS66 family insertion sequence element accessory protein TnpA [Desulforhopalus sp. 52FAK]